MIDLLADLVGVHPLTVVVMLEEVLGDGERLEVGEGVVLLPSEGMME